MLSTTVVPWYVCLSMCVSYKKYKYVRALLTFMLLSIYVYEMLAIHVK